MAFVMLQRFSENGDAIEALAQRTVISDSSFFAACTVKGCLLHDATS
jgi:hypothetical protein